MDEGRQVVCREKASDKESTLMKMNIKFCLHVGECEVCRCFL